MKRYPENFTKGDMVIVHLTLFYLKTFFESAGISNDYFYEYDKLRVYPSHIYVDRHKHATAITLLARGILSILKSNQPEIKV